MKKRTSKRYNKLLDTFKDKKVSTLEESIKKVKQSCTAKFDESIDVSLNLNLKQKKEELTLRTVVNLPHGNGKKIKIGVLCEEGKTNEAKTSGADISGSDSYVEEIMSGKINFDKLIATPAMMSKMGKLGKILGPKGLMPNPKLGSVSENIKEAIEEIPDGTFVGVRDRSILEVFYGGGIRLGELVGLNIASVDLKAGLLFVDSKTKGSRTAPIGRPAVQALVDYIRLRGCLIKDLGIKKSPEALFLGVNARPLSRRAVQKRVFSGLGRVVDSKILNPNMLRQSFKTHLLNSGADVASVRYMLGQVVVSSFKGAKKTSVEKLTKVYAQAHPRSN